MAHPNRQSFRVEKPFRIYRHIGDSPSNTYVGRSMAHNAIYEARNVRPGDEIHVLPGGTFHVDSVSGRTWSVSLSAPRHLFEKSYGHVSDHSVLESRARRGGTVIRVDEPETSPDWKAARDAMISFPAIRSPLVEIDRSPELEDLMKALAPARRALVALKREDVVDHKGNPPTEAIRDHTDEPVVRYHVSFGDYVTGVRGEDVAARSIAVEWCYIPAFARVTVPEGLDLPPACGEATSAGKARSGYQMDLGTLSATLPAIVQAHVEAVCARTALAPR